MSVVVVRRVSDGLERHINLRNGEIMTIGRSFVATSRTVAPADMYVSVRRPCILRKRGLSLFLENPHRNAVRVTSAEGGTITIRDGDETDVTRKRVKFCPNDTAQGAQSTILEFMVNVHEEEEESETEDESPVYVM